MTIVEAGTIAGERHYRVDGRLVSESELQAGVRSERLDGLEPDPVLAALEGRGEEVTFESYAAERARQAEPEPVEHVVRADGEAVHELALEILGKETYSEEEYLAACRIAERQTEYRWTEVA